MEWRKLLNDNICKFCLSPDVGGVEIGDAWQKYEMNKQFWLKLFGKRLRCIDKNMKLKWTTEN